MCYYIGLLLIDILKHTTLKHGYNKASGTCDFISLYSSSLQYVIKSWGMKIASL